MGEALLGTREIRPCLREGQWPVRRSEGEISAHAGGEIQHDVDTGIAHPLDHLAVERRIARRLPRLRIAHMHVDDRGPRPCRVDSGLGDLHRGHRHLVGTARGIAGAGQRAGDEGFTARGEGHGAVLP